MTVAVSWWDILKLLKMFHIELPEWLTTDPANYTGEGFQMNCQHFLSF